MVEVAGFREELHHPRRVRGRSSRTWRIVVHDVERVGPGDFDRLLDEVPVPVDDLSAHARGPGPREIFHAERREELLDPLRHRPSRDRRRPFFRGERHEIRIHESREFVPDRAFEQLLHRLRRIVEESVVGVRSGNRDRVGADLPPSVRSDDPVRVEERELGVARNRVDVPTAQVVPFRADLPVFASEVEIRVLLSDTERVSDVDRVAAGRIDQESRRKRVVPEGDVHANLSSRVDVDAIRRGPPRKANLQVVSRDVDRLDIGSEEEFRARALRLLPERLRERRIIDRRVRL